MNAPGGMMRQISVERLFDDNEARLGFSWLAGRQGGNRVLTGDAALRPTIGQVGHMNFIHPFRIQILGAAEDGVPAGAAGRARFAIPIRRLFTSELVAIVVANGEDVPAVHSRTVQRRTTSRSSRRRSRRRILSK